MKNIKNAVTGAAVALLVGAMSLTSFADSQWDRSAPNQNEVSYQHQIAVNNAVNAELAQHQIAVEQAAQQQRIAGEEHEQLSREIVAQELAQHQREVDYLTNQSYNGNQPTQDRGNHHQYRQDS